MAGFDRLWAPWRQAYLATTRRPRRGCVFCRARRSRRDRQTYVLSRGPRTFVVLNRYPYNNGHLMVALNRHCGDLSRLTRDESAELWHATMKTVEVVRRLLRPHGVNIGLNLGRAAGAGIPHHLHIHIVPRWVGDTNFITTVGGMKVISASLEALYRRLKPLMPTHDDGHAHQRR